MGTFGIISFDTDGSFLNGHTQDGIGRIFHDDQGNFLLHFGKQINAESAIHREIVTIREGFLIAATSRMVNYARFIF